MTHSECVGGVSRCVRVWESSKHSDIVSVGTRTIHSYGSYFTAVYYTYRQLHVRDYTPIATLYELHSNCKPCTDAVPRFQLHHELHIGDANYIKTITWRLHHLQWQCTAMESLHAQLQTTDHVTSHVACCAHCQSRCSTVVSGWGAGRAGCHYFRVRVSDVGCLMGPIEADPI